jgi:hypothetical protein
MPDQSQAGVLDGTGLGSLESPTETRRARGFTRVARKGVRITLQWPGMNSPFRAHSSSESKMPTGSEQRRSVGASGLLRQGASV